MTKQGAYLLHLLLQLPCLLLQLLVLLLCTSQLLPQLALLR
jgi:hypothetical protein